ncbi:MAG: hypothetical protein IJ223_02060 [Clostridia bacterium]|nr:hypothetical protein [Clostridia bacterium]
MKKIALVGAYDKTDFILYIGKILSILGKSVLVIDTTITQKAKYVVPVINPTRAYLTEYETIDVAVGFKSMEDMKGYLGLQDEEELKYDYALIDVDSPEEYEAFKMNEAATSFFVTSFDLYSLKRGLEVLSGLTENVKMTKVLFSKNMLKAEDEYLDFLSSNYKVEWEKEKIFLPFEQGDQSIIIENQRAAKIKLRNLSTAYKEGIVSMVTHIMPETSYSEAKKALRVAEKGV